MKLLVTRLAMLMFALLILAGCARTGTLSVSPGSLDLGSGARIANAAAGAGIAPAGTSGRNPAIVSGILTARCVSCHGRSITDLNRLVAHRKVIPGNPDASPLFQMACGKGPCGPAIPKGELQEISDWINALAVRGAERR